MKGKMCVAKAKTKSARKTLDPLYQSQFTFDQDPAGIAAVLLLIMLPQVVLYGCIAVLVAIQHSRESFLLPSFAPTIENVGVIGAVVLIGTLSTRAVSHEPVVTHT